MAATEDTRLRCPACGYNLTGLNQASCPECGQRFLITARKPPRPPLTALHWTLLIIFIAVGLVLVGFPLLLWINGTGR